MTIYFLLIITNAISCLVSDPPKCSISVWKQICSVYKRSLHIKMESWDQVQTSLKHDIIIRRVRSQSSICYVIVWYKWFVMNDYGPGIFYSSLMNWNSYVNWSWCKFDTLHCRVGCLRKLASQNSSISPNTTRLRLVVFGLISLFWLANTPR